MSFKNLWILIFLFSIPFLDRWWKKQKNSSLNFSTLTEIKQSGGYLSVRFRHNILSSLKLLAIAGIILALARPQTVSSEKEYETEGIDIIIALDISGSMQAMDFQPANRLEVAKEEAKKFIKGRQHDRIGLVIFSAQSYTQCPLTLDYDVLTSLLDQVQMGLIKDGTAIGLAIANAVNRLRDSAAKSKIVILITDGANNAGNIDPITATEIARKFGIRVHTIGVGKGGLVPFPVDDPLFGRRYVQAEVEMDEPLLQRIALMTGGAYFRARDEQSLSTIYKKIDELEKTKVKVKEYSIHEELFPVFLLPGILALFFATMLENTVFFKLS